MDSGTTTPTHPRPLSPDSPTSPTKPFENLPTDNKNEADTPPVDFTDAVDFPDQRTPPGCTCTTTSSSTTTDFPDFDWSSSGLGTENSTTSSSTNSSTIEEFTSVESSEESSVYYDAVGFEEVKYKRSSSLRVSSAGRNVQDKKIVRFADCLGLDLVDVKIFLDEIPKVPDCAFRDLVFEIPEPPKPKPQQIPLPLLVPKFHQPIEEPDFSQRLGRQKVLLESCHATPTNLIGTVRVINEDFHKSVYIRFTLDEWASFKESQACYTPLRHTPRTDAFSFCLPLHPLPPTAKKLIFALRYHTLGQIFWDNNNSNNYVFQIY